MSFKKKFKSKSPVRHNLPQYGFKSSDSKIKLGSSKSYPLGKVVDEDGNAIPGNSKIAREHYKELMLKLFESNFVPSSGGKSSNKELLIDKGNSNAETVLPVAKQPYNQTEEERLKSLL